jgi:hypothetical protein
MMPPVGLVALATLLLGLAMLEGLREGGFWPSDGAVAPFGDGPFLGSVARTVLNGMIIASSGY